MYRTQCVLALLALHVGLAYSFSWDVVLARKKQIVFYNNGTRTYSVMPSSDYISWLTYDPVHERVLFAEKINPNFLNVPVSVSSLDIATGKIDILIEKKRQLLLDYLAYDPATELLFGTIYTYPKNSLNSFSLKPGSNKGVANYVLKLDARPRDIVVDSCGGYIYWTTSKESNVIERVRFDGSEREVVMNSSDMIRRGLTIDPETQRMYWTEFKQNKFEFLIESADLKGENRRTLHRESTIYPGYSKPEKLSVSKDFIYWGDDGLTCFWKFPKKSEYPRDTDVKPIRISLDNTTYSLGFRSIATNYNIAEQTQGIQNCQALTRLLPNSSETNDCASLNVSTDESLLCVHGTKVSGETRCECTQGYSGERCDVSVCHNYCFQGVCSVSAEGQPKCRCNAGYSGQRCEVYFFLVKCFRTISMLKDILYTDMTPVTLGKGVKSTFPSTVVGKTALARNKHKM